MPSLNTGNAILSNAIAVNSSYNVGIGGAASGSLKLQVTGSDILVNGLTIGEGAGSIGSNTVVGASALPVNTTGTFNTAIGNSALLTNTTGYGNTSVGYSAIGYNTTGFFNAGVGVNALLSNTTGTYNNALGTAALYANTTGSYNTAVGQQAGTANTTGSNNTYIGYSSGLNITTGSNNTIIGNFAGTSALANNIVLADGAGNVRYQWNGTNNAFTGAATFSSFVGINGSPATAFPLEAYINSSTAYTTSSRGNVMRVYNSNSGSNVFAGIELGGAGPSNDGLAGLNAVVTSAGSAALTFYTRDSNTFAEKMRITSGGNVGIGTSSPDTALQLGRVFGFNQDVNSGYIDCNIKSNGNYIISQFATRIHLDSALGEIKFLNAPSGTANAAATLTERMRITSGGNVLIGTTSVGSQGTLNSYTNNANPAGRFISGPSTPDGNIVLMVDKYSSTNTTSQWFLGFTISNQGVASGVITANGASQAAFGSWSDRRLKENITDLEPQLHKILALRPVEFDYIKSEGGGHQISFIAQEFEEVYPDAVGERQDGMKTLTGWGKTESILVKSIQELHQLVQEQQAQIEELTQKVNALENR